MTTDSTTTELPKQYDPAQAQDRWYQFWLEKGYFHSEPDPNPARPTFTIVIPPPNVTGALHLGHALNNTLQDILIRWHRMMGDNTLWMPGTDHAGIATQAVVERRLFEEEKLTRHDLGREKLVERIWAWKKEYEKRILGQLQQMGFSCDWARLRFTFDDQCARAVRHTFFHLFRDNLIGRAKRLVNWDAFLQTSVANDELDNVEQTSDFYYFRYPFAPGSPTDGLDFVLIATTRPETMLGDTCVAVHPNPRAELEKRERKLRDELASATEKEREEIESRLQRIATRKEEALPLLERLASLAQQGAKLTLPLVGRTIPLIPDPYADPEKGTGAVKITPAHDFNDWEVGTRHPEIGPPINILLSDGKINSFGQGTFQGETFSYQKLDRFDARKKIVSDLERLGLLDKIEQITNSIPLSDRSKTPVEPYLSDQWFVKMGSQANGRPGLARMTMDAVSNGKVKIVPERYSKTYLDWLGEERDWCVSRQLWWGHSIPVWTISCQDQASLNLVTQTLDTDPLLAQLKRDNKLAYQVQEDEELIWAKEFGGQAYALAKANRPFGFVHISLVEDHPEAISRLAAFGPVPDPDVLDTWFSSALWPHSTLGWPEKTKDLAYYYPTSTLITSRDIITLWVARMVLTGIYNLGEVPFREVYIHPKILDGFGEGMSKSKGNGVDPLDVIEKFGADSMRFALAYITTETQDVRMPVEFECPHCQALIEQTKKNRIQPRVDCKKCGKPFSTQWASKPDDVALPRGAVVSERFELGRNFCNKLWNASRFALMNLEGYTAAPVKDSELMVEDRWILSRLSTVTGETSKALREYRYADAGRVLYDFAWNEFCSFYVEMVKGRLQDAAARPVAQRVLAYTLDNLLRLLHPFIPFITEEVWQRLAQAAPQRGLAKPAAPAESIMIAPWPVADTARQDSQIEARFARFQELLAGLREIRSRQNIPPKSPIHFFVKADAATVDLLKPMASYFESMAGAKAEAWGSDVQAPATNATFVGTGGMEVYVDLAEFIDVEAEKARKTKEIAKLEQMIAGKEKQLSNENFVSRAPAEVIQKEQAALELLRIQLAAAIESLKALNNKK